MNGKRIIYNGGCDTLPLKDGSTGWSHSVIVQLAERVFRGGSCIGNGEGVLETYPIDALTKEDACTQLAYAGHVLVERHVKSEATV